MSSCDGFCFRHHEECSDNDHKVYLGGNGKMDVYCKKKNSTCNCVLYACHNFQHCQRKVPYFLWRMNQEMCLSCAIHLGKLYFEKKIGDCPICLEPKELVGVCCQKHSYCLSCWLKHCQINTGFCPLCRESIWAWKRV